jgi:hypothetical protein
MESEDLIEPFRRAGQEYIESFKGDDKAMLEDLRRRAKASGKKIVNFPPKKVLSKPVSP